LKNGEIINFISKKEKTMKSIRTKVLAIITCIFVLLVIGSQLVSMQILKTGFKDFEKHDAALDIKRAKKALEAEIDYLSSINLDWAVWDETYRFMKETNKKFIEENIVSNFFIEQQMAFIIFLNPDQSLYWGRGFDFTKNQEKIIGADFSSFFSDRIVFKSNEIYSGFRGILNAAGKTYIITAHKIFKTDHSGLSNGILVMGKELDSSLLKKIGKRVDLNVEFYVSESVDLPLWAENAFKDKNSLSIVYPDNEKLIAYTKLKDVSGLNSFILSAELEREIYNLGRKTIRYFFISLLLLGLVLSMLTYLLLETQVIRRIKNLSRQVKNLYLQKPGKRTVVLEGRDELTLLAYEINKMLKLLDLKSNALESMTVKLKSVNSHLYELANTDPLTRLANRRNIFAYLSSFIEIAKRYNKSFCICIFDIDNFKQINDKYGHSAGDIVLKDISEASEEIIRKADKLARIGGEEFLLLLSDTDIEGAVSLCERLRFVLASRTVRADNNKIKYTSSFGVTAYLKDKDSTDSIFMRADKYLYKAKSKGKNAVVSDINYFYQNET
jgi:diguanylate cyclase (GGDEF)-like protein